MIIKFLPKANDDGIEAEMEVESGEKIFSIGSCQFDIHDWTTFLAELARNEESQSRVDILDENGTILI